MRHRHLRQVMAIEHQVFPEPWSLAIFNSELALRTGRAYRVAKVGRRVVGYVGLMIVTDEAHVTTLAVAPESQHQGIGTEILLRGVLLARELGARQLSLEVAAHNARAQALYRRFGLAPVGVRKGYYQKTGEDALVMVVDDIGSEAYSRRLAQIEAWLRSPE
ncbi:MAG: ribosomal protein S18-alanine N-acetyltransferase [Actinomycetota bacterium]|nr:ribosomal protein S18-alanine N-acetyltransferase [Actinomycetota bacterium]